MISRHGEVSPYVCFSLLKLQEQKPFSYLETPFLDLLALSPCPLYVLNLKLPASSGEIAGAEYAVGGRGERNLQRGGNKVPIYRNTSSWPAGLTTARISPDWNKRGLQTRSTASSGSGSRT